MSHIAVIEANPVGLRAMEIAKDAGHDVTFFSSDIDFYLKGRPIKEHPIGAAVRHVECSSTTDVTSLLDAVKGIDREHPFDAILTFDDLWIEPVAHVAGAMGLARMNPGAVTRARNKLLTRNVLAEAGMSRPRYRFVRSLPEARDAARELGFPLVGKPIDGTASIGVELIESEAQLAPFLARSFGRKSYGGRSNVAFQGGVLLEEFVSGELVSVEAVHSPGAFHALGVTERELQGFTEVGFTFPSDQPFAGAAIRTARQATEALGIDFGLTHTELLIPDDGSEPVVVEVNARLGGARIPSLIRACLGIDPQALLIDLHLGRFVGSFPKPQGAAHSFHFTADREGVFREVQGWEAIEAASDVFEARWTCPAGRVVRRAESNMDWLGWFTIRGATAGQVRERGRQLRQQVALIISERSGP